MSELTPRRARPRAQDGPHVLVVEDDPATRRLLREIVLEALPGCRLSEAADGARALRLAGSAPPDIALVDLVLPGSPVSGALVCQELCRTAHTRVVVVSGLASAAALARGEGLGIAGHVRKPFSADQVRAYLVGWGPASPPAQASTEAAPIGPGT